MIQTMKLKHVFFSSLLLSVGFTACTNDELVEVSAPVNTQDAIALGENFSISVVKGAAESRAVFDEALKSQWEKTDTVGAAWVNMITEYEKDGSVKTVQAFADTKFYSNHPFSLDEGAGTNLGQFSTVTNAFAGAYALYFPYDASVAMTGEEIPVKIKSYEFDGSEPLKNISKNMFSYSPVKFVKGGNQTEEFHLEPVPVLFKVWFKPSDKLNMDLSSGGLEIKNIVIMAGNSTAANGDATGTQYLYEEGKVVPTAYAKTMTAARYNDAEDNLNDKDKDAILAYQGKTETDHLFIATSNCNTDDYKLLEKEVATKKPFIFSTLPFKEGATYYTIKVVTDKGVYKRTYNANDPDDKAITDVLAKAENEGGQVTIGVTLDVTEKDDVIYTAEEFVSRWNDAVAAGKHVELQIGTPLTLTDELVCNNTTADVKVTGDKLTVPSMNLQTTSKNGIEFNNAVVVEGKLFTTGNADLKANDLTPETVEIQGDANLTVAEVKEMSIATSGVVTVAGKDTESTIGKIVNRGRLIPNTTNLVIESLDSTDGNVTFDSNFTNKGTMTLSDINMMSGNTFTNEGTVTLSGVFTGEFVNAAGATLNINADQAEMKLTNNAADATKNKDAAVVNIAADVTVTADGTNTIENKGIINVAGNLTEATDQKLTQTDNNARIIATDEDAVITLLNTTALTNGYVVILKNDNVPSFTGEPIAYSLTATTGVTVPTNATTIFVNCAVKASELTTLSLTGKNLVFYNNITLDAALTLTGDFTVAGNVTVNNSTDGELALTLQNGETNKIAKGATLSLSKNVELTASASSTTLTVEGEFKKGEGTVNANVTLSYSN